MTMSFAHYGLVVLLFATAASAQLVKYCPFLGGSDIDWNINQYQRINIYTRLQGTNTYGSSSDCHFSIKANVRGRIIVQVLDSNLYAFAASISISTSILSGYLASWDQITYDRDRHNNFISQTNQLYISFRTRSSPTGFSSGVHLALTFLPSYGCPPYWTPMTLDGQPSCVGRPTSSVYKFGAAQRYCNLQRSNLLVAERDNIASVLQRVNAANVWIGMTAEPSGSFSSYRWISNIRVSTNASVSCTGGCRPGSSTHRCVYARDWRSLVQIECGQSLQPLCYMPTGGTDTFYASSSALRSSGALLAGALLLFWSLLR